ncbi:GATA transcription factor 5-like isoform X2 [Phragmites australis]|uniref:GATA transcription factor 5-like isoform X2 n=1 Tax=Phragmites australis TaxID=29695 RepID=UPI002D77DDC1|nr:GATA transcription factor 5-like isoform X2 [Phragmites australis]
MRPPTPWETCSRTRPPCDDSSLEWLSVYVEDCFSSSTSYPHPVFAKTAPTMAGKTKLLPPSSSNAKRKKRSLASVMSDDDEQQYIIPLFVEPPLLLIDQKHWMAESELILPKKDKDQELCQQQELKQEEEKCEKGAVIQFQRERLVKRCSNCLSYETPRWRHGPSGLMMLCNVCGLRLKPENGFTTISKKQCGQGTNKEQRLGKQRDKKIKKTANPIEELPLEQPAKRCTHCMSSKTPQWRAGPLGPKTLCNACGVRFKSGRLLPEYRPVNSPTFVSDMHSNSHKKVLQLRQSVADKGN